MSSLAVTNGGAPPEAAAIAPHKGPVNPSLKGLRYVIFPDNRWAQAWDCVMICNIWYFSLYIPFHFGISMGYYTVYYTWYMIFNTCLNLCFLIDTFLSFFRAYRDEHGRMVFSLRSIRRHYVRSGWFFVNLLASIPASSLVYGEAKEAMDSGDTQPLDNPNMRLYFILELFKLLRLLRIKKIMKSSDIMKRLWEKVNVEFALTAKFMFMMILASHWIACIWGLIAFAQAGTFSDPEMLNTLTWMSGWYDANYVEGVLNPIGWSQVLPRYWLCLFWAIQSITSIGYGNIAPQTTLEYAFANFLMLLCGIFWAYIIGNLVEVVQSLGTTNQDYVRQMNEANKMIKDFTSKDLPESVTGVYYSTKSSKRVRSFITNQRDRDTKTWLDSNNACSLTDAYPTLKILSPELQRVCTLHLTHSLIETIPYLSSKYLSPEEQSAVAMQSVSLEFSAGEKFVAHAELGRGIIIVREGFAFTSRAKKGRGLIGWRNDLTDQPIDVNEVLLEDDFSAEHHLVYHFIGFTRAFFVPRSAIIEALETNELAWKECARWRYFVAAFILYSLKDSEKTL